MIAKKRIPAGGHAYIDPSFSFFPFFPPPLVISGRPRSWEIDKKSSKQIENKLFAKCYSVNFYFKRTSEMKSEEDFDSFLAPTLKTEL